MAKSLTQINLDYNRAMSQASELEAVARELRDISNSTLQQSLSQVGASWKGENADAYIKKGQILQRKIGASAKDLSEAAKTIRSIARRIREADLRALEIASSS